MATLQPKLILLSAISFIVFGNLDAQDSLATSYKNRPINKDLTIAYSIDLKLDDSKTSIGEAYNGGVKTVFISGNKARVRLVSLMRMHSIFKLSAANARGETIIVKESGKNRYKSYLTKEDWKQYNRKYDSATCKLSSDTATIQGYPCRTAIIALNTGYSVKIFFTDSLSNPLFSQAEPLFTCIPGIVLKYEYEQKNRIISYTATQISTNKVSDDVFKIPEKGYALRKFSSTQSIKAAKESTIENTDE